MNSTKYFELEKAYLDLFGDFYNSPEARASKNKYTWAEEQMRQVIETLRTKAWRKYP